MRNSTFAAIVVVAAACAPATPVASSQPTPPRDGLRAGASALERELLTQLNAVRADPRRHARVLERRLPHYDGNLLRLPGRSVTISTQEGASAVREAVDALRATPPRPRLTRSAGLSAAARDHVVDQGSRGLVGHAGRDGSTSSSRANRHGRWRARLTESIAYGPATGSDVVVELIVDDGVRDRGHRRNLLDPAVRVAGVACGSHARFRTMCVILLAGAFDEPR